MLSKHYEEADGFDIVFFLPDSEDDFASYTEFLQYLRLKNRAGVAKLEDGTTLFLVPPSDFLTQVLKVSGPERLYGVVLKIPQQAPPAQTGYAAAARLSEDRAPSMEYSRPLQEELLPHSTAGRPFSGQMHGSLPVSYASNAMASQPVEVSLTPELIATLAAVIPTSALATSAGPVQPPLSSSVKAAPSASVPLVPQLWSQQPQTPVSSGAHHEQPGLPALLAGQQFANQSAQIRSYTNAPTTAQENLSAIQQAASISVPPFNNYVVSQPVGQFTASQPNTQSQADVDFGSSRSHGISRPAEATGLAGAAGPQLPNSAASSQVQSGNLLQHWIVSSSTEDKLNTDFPAQVQQLQTNLPSSTQAPSEAEMDKNQRYQSTLQLAANLLLQIQQQQQQANSQSVQGSGGHQ